MLFADLTSTCEKRKEGCVRVVLPSSLSLLPLPFVLFWIEQVFASVITALAKWPVRVRAAFQTENKSRGSGKLKAGHFDWLSSLVSEQRCIVGKSPVERERVSFLSFFLLVMPASFSAKQEQVSQHLSYRS